MHDHLVQILDERLIEISALIALEARPSFAATRPVMFSAPIEAVVA